jgi:hypothetical protein
MDQTRQLWNGPKQEIRNAIDVLGADIMRFASDLEARLNSDFQGVEVRFEKGHIKNEDEFFDETTRYNITSLDWVDWEMNRLIERNNMLRAELAWWVVRTAEVKRKARDDELNREKNLETDNGSDLEN